MDTRIANIVVGYDASPSSSVALDKAAELAGAFQSQLHVVYSDHGDNKLDWDKAHIVLDELRMRTGIPIHIHHQQGRPFKEILHVERQIQAGLIVVGTHGHAGYMPQWLGSTAYRVVNSSRCPVIVVQESARDLSWKQILVPLVDSPESRQKLVPAALMAKKFGSTVHILGVCRKKDPEAEHQLLIYCKQAVEFFDEEGVPNTHKVVSGVNVPQTVIDYSSEVHAGLILMMTETEAGNMFMGSLAQQLINHSPIPVMAIHNKHPEGLGGSGY